MGLNVESIKALLREPRTILELNEALEERKMTCPDDLARKLNKMLKQGLIKGRFSEEKSAWVYWVDDQHE
jgi:predicted transcriptional regulator